MENTNFKVYIEKTTQDYGCLYVEPLERGYGDTLGNTLRRLLLSSIKGVAVTIKINGVKNEFGTVPGVREEVVEILMNLRHIPIKLKTENPQLKPEGYKLVRFDSDKLPKNFFTRAENPGVVTARDLPADKDFEFCGDGVLCTLESGAHLVIDFYIEPGVGYLSAERERPSYLPKDALLTDVIFSPVKRVNYRIKPARVGQSIDYERLVLEVWTNGTISPEKSLEQAAKIAKDYFDNIVKNTESAENSETESDLTPVSVLGLSKKIEESLKEAGFETVESLLELSDKELLKIKGFGKQSLVKLKEKLEAKEWQKDKKQEIQVPAAEPLPVSEAEKADEVANSDPAYGRLYFEHLEKGYGDTLGNALRRLLLSSIKGVAVTAVRIDGVLHEFSTVKGVREDVIEILMNLKHIPIRAKTEKPQLKPEGYKLLTLDSDDLPKSFFERAENPGVITAKDMPWDNDFEFCGDGVLCTLEPDAHLVMELYIEPGIGYLSAERERPAHLPLDALLADAIFSPIKRVNYHVDQNSDFDSLALEVWTNGAVLPENAVDQAAKIAKDCFAHIAEIVKDAPVIEPEKTKSIDNTTNNAETDTVGELELYEPEDEIKPYDDVPIHVLELSLRSENCLKKVGIENVGQLLRKSHDDLLKIRNLGKKSLIEIEEKLSLKGWELSLSSNTSSDSDSDSDDDFLDDVFEDEEEFENSPEDSSTESEKEKSENETPAVEPAESEKKPEGTKKPRTTRKPKEQKEPKAPKEPKKPKESKKTEKKDKDSEKDSDSKESKEKKVSRSRKTTSKKSAEKTAEDKEAKIETKVEAEEKPEEKKEVKKSKPKTKKATKTKKAEAESKTEKTEAKSESEVLDSASKGSKKKKATKKKLDENKDQE